MGIEPSIEQVKKLLETALSHREDNIQRIKYYTDEWVKAQKEIISFTKMLKLLGYTYNYKFKNVPIFNNTHYCKVKLIKLKEDK